MLSLVGAVADEAANLSKPMALHSLWPRAGEISLMAPALLRDDRLWSTFCDIISQPELATDPRYIDRDERKRRAFELHALLAPIFASKTYAEWEALLSKTGIPFGEAAI